LVRTGRQGLLAPLDRTWSRHDFEAQADWGWRSGLILEFPTDRGLRLSRIRVDRGRALPPLRTTLTVVASSLMVAVALGAAGVGAVTALLGGWALLLGQLAALWADPLVAAPVVVPGCGIAIATALLASLIQGCNRMASRRGLSSLPPMSLAAVALGFGFWFAAMTSPLYRGGHFVFHSSIAEEIWKGEFLTYYLPYPGSMLSRQDQWGSVVVPHSCLYHTLAAPLAALPQPWFYLAEKAALGLMLASIGACVSLIGLRVAGPLGAGYAGVVFACLPPTYQLLGLGHLLTAFGCWASTLALTHLAFSLGRLGQPWRWWTAVGLLSLCFLSYTAALLFTGLVLAAMLSVLAWSDPRNARPLAGAVLLAAALAFLLYYVHWAWPFLTESVPALLRREAAPVVPWQRLTNVRRALDYTYGSALLPLAGMLGLALVARRRERIVLWPWAGILVLFTVLGISFNFLHKHHYYVMPPIGLGVGLALATLSAAGTWGRRAAGALVLLVGLLGLRMALAVALGSIP